MLRPALLTASLFALLCSDHLSAAEARIALASEHGDLSHALVSFHALDREYELDPDSLATMDQLNREFRPHAIAVEQGGHVRFLNNDDVRHHIYSFSAPKRFELPLYQGEPPEDIRFEQAGEVVLGCNIHDWMLGWVHVMDTPYFAFADEHGEVTLSLPAGEYELRIWHPKLQAEERQRREAMRITEEGIQRQFTLDLAVPEDDGFDRRRRNRF